jgi:hypothetical protein
MFQLFLRARTHNLLNKRKANKTFRARSASRNAETDQLRIASIFKTVEEALRAAEFEKSGLLRRVDDAVGLASMTVGNGSDEYLTRERRDTNHLNELDAEISNGQRRIDELTESVGHFKFLRTAILTRFPKFKPVDENSVADSPPRRL